MATLSVTSPHISPHGHASLEKNTTLSFGLIWDTTREAPFNDNYLPRLLRGLRKKKGKKKPLLISQNEYNTKHKTLSDKLNVSI